MLRHCRFCRLRRLAICCVVLLIVLQLIQLIYPCIFFTNRETCKPTSVNKPSTKPGHQQRPTTESNLKLPHAENQSSSADWHNIVYRLNNESRCSAQEVFLMIFVHSAPSHIKERQLIRHTWASVTRYAGRNTNTIFLLALPSSSAMQQELVAESRRYGDIIQGDFIDHYRNLTRKHIMGYNWILSYCRHAKFFIKADDDTLINTYRTILYLLQTYSASGITNLLYCSVYYRQHVVRRISDKWYVSLAEYPYERYPDYCEGFAYIVTSDVVQKLYAASLHTKYYWIDDVYVTGILANKTRIIPRQFHSPNAYEIMSQNHASELVNKALFFLAKYDRSEEMWLAVWDTAEKNNMESVKSH